MDVKNMKKWMKRVTVIFFCVCFLGVAAVFGVNTYVKESSKNRILSPEAASELDDVDCVLILGCFVHDNGEPSDMLADRLKRGIELYESGAAPKLLMSGDHGQTEYDEVNVMKQYAVDAGVPSENIFMDHAGFSTYESIYRARDIFEAKKILIVTQEYHLYRALYIARQLGLDAYGVTSDQNVYVGAAKRETREVLARVKDFMGSIVKPKPTYLGEAIPVNGNGDQTND